MAFTVYKTNDGRVAPVEYMPAGAITPKYGMALTMASGKLAICAGANKPAYVSVIEKDVACEAGELIPVVRVEDGMIFTTTLSAAGTSLVPGVKVTIAAGGMQATATTTDGVAEVVEIVDPAVGGEIRVRF